MKVKTLFFLLTVLLFGAVSPVRAFEMRDGSNVTVSKDTVIKGTLVAGGSTVAIDGTVDGDLYCAAQTLTIRGAVNGDVLCAAQSITITGTVGDSVRVVSQLLDISGNIKRNVAAMGQTVVVNPGASVSGELMAAGQTINLNSTIGGDVTTAAESMILGDKARLAGNVTYTSQAEVLQATGAAVSGTVTHLLPPKENKELLQMKQIRPNVVRPVRSVGSTLFLLCVGLLVVWLGKASLKRITIQMLARPLFDGFIGLLTMIGTPIAIILLTITIIGIPVAVLLGIAFGLALLLSRIYVSIVVGQKILKTASPYWQVVLGVVVLEICSHIPFLGFLISCIATLWGLGGIVMNIGKRKITK